MGTIWLLRHGQTTANAQEVIQGPRIDAPLSELGQRQAASLGEALAAEPLAAIYSSPLVRARDTAAAVVRHHHDERTRGKLAVQVVPDLYEMDYGAFVGQPYQAIRDEMDQVLDAWRMGFTDEPFPGGESALLAQTRIRPFAHRLVEAAAAPDRHVAVVAHGRINRVLIATLTGAGLTRLEEFPQSNACINELGVDGPVAVTVRRLNDTRHLRESTDAFS